MCKEEEEEVEIKQEDLNTETNSTNLHTTQYNFKANLSQNTGYPA